MNEKSHVGMEARICIVCGEQYDTGIIFLDKRLRNTLEHHNVTGTGICPEHQKYIDDGYIILVGVDPERSTIGENQTVKPTNAYRTGSVAFMKADLWDDFTEMPRPPDAIAYVEDEIISLLNDINEKAKENIDEPKIQ